MDSQQIEKLKKSFNKVYADKFNMDHLERELFLPINIHNNALFVALAEFNNKEKVEKVLSQVKEKLNTEHIKMLNLSKDEFNYLFSNYKSMLNIYPKDNLENVIPKKESNSPLPQRKRIGDMLIEAGLITNEQLMEALAIGKETGSPIGSVLVKSGYITVENLREVLSAQQGIETIEAKEIGFDRNITKILPEDFINSNKVVPISTDGKTLVVGMVNPTDKKTLNEIIYLTGLMPVPHLLTHIDFEHYVENLFASQNRADKIIEEASLEEMSSSGNLWEQLERELQDNSGAIAKFTNQIIIDAIEAKASDIHIEPRIGMYVVRQRINGILKKVLEIPEKIESSVISRFKVIARMNIAEHRRAQDGTFSIKYQNKSYDMRINTIPVGTKEKMVIRILQPMVNMSEEITQIQLAGASEYDLQRIKFMTSAPNGIILTAGPTGSGKTTTLYSILRSINDEKVNITTVEDPIEIRLEGINQTQVNPKADITFASCMRAILRQDPDIIMLGEIRDAETLDVSISAALTGHLVLSTVHTNSATATITRLIQMGAQEYLIASTLTGVIAQRLVRQLCPHCKEKYNASFDEAKKIIAQKEYVQEFIQKDIYRAKGCERCGYDGYSGRLGVFEVLPINREIKKLIAQSAPDVEIEEVAISCGMKTLSQSCLAHIINGETSIEEFVRVLGVVSD